MELNELLGKLTELQHKLAAYSHAMSLLHFDGSTIAPKGSAANRGNTMGVFSGILYEMATGDETGNLLKALREREGELDELQKRQVSELWREYNQAKKVPADEFVAFRMLVNEADSVWHDAKEKNDFPLFQPYLEKIFETSRRFAAYYDSEKPAYDALMDEYERGLTMEVCDSFFKELRDKLVPLISAVKEKGIQPDTSFLEKEYPLDKQRELADYVLQLIGVDRNHCQIAETEHPFTTSFGKDDVRVTTHYYLNNPLSALYSTIHEGGHALYELNTGDALRRTCLESGASMGLHESQSRFYENIIGRGKAFIEFIFPKLKELFPTQLEGIDAGAFYRAVNKIEPSLIRTEADELTYCMHIMIRYELEKQLITGKMDVKDLPAEWNAKYKEYLGIDVPSDSKGVLQDVHWSGGMIGYFPSYALGSAYGAQILSALRQDMDFEAVVASGNLGPVNNWLRERIWAKGRTKDPTVIFEECCGEPFSAAYYTDYLTKKYTEIYSL